jgi:hypothetical protein
MRHNDFGYWRKDYGHGSESGRNTGVRGKGKNTVARWYRWMGRFTTGLKGVAKALY